jgi:hypothetical protein
MQRFSHRFPRTGRNSRRAARRPIRPAIEALEDRSLLSLFGTTLPFIVGPSPTSPVVADFNGDGKQDLAVVTTSQNGTVSVLLNRGFSSFATPVNYNVPGASALAVGDFNGDGQPDLAVAAGASGITVLLNNSNGYFASRFTVSQPASAIVVADFNGDGKQDLAVANNGTVSVLLKNTNQLDFTLAGSYALGSFSAALAVGDFNRDGKPDLVVSPGPATGIAVLLNKGDGTMAAPLPVSVGTLPYVDSLAVGDCNGDGKPDLVATQGYLGIFLLTGNGDGTFGPLVVVNEESVGGIGKGIAALGDFNGDGKLDIANSTTWVGGRAGSASEVDVLPGAGDGTFQSPLTFHPGAIGTFTLAVGDINGDGRSDLVVCATRYDSAHPITDTSVSVMLNTSKGPINGSYLGAFDPDTASWYLRGSPGSGTNDISAFPWGGVGWDPVVGDWDGNGSTTIGVVDPATMTWYLRNSNSTGAPDYGPFTYGLPGWIPVAGDWTGSGHTGIGVFDLSTGTWYLRNEDSPGPADAGVFQYGGVGWKPLVGDWDGNGTTTVGVVDPSTWTAYLRNSNSSGPPDITPFPAGGGLKLVVGDWTSQGPSVVGTVAPDTCYWYLPSSTGGFPNVVSFSVNVPAGVQKSSWIPVAGHFSGIGPGIGTYYPGNATWLLRSAANAGDPDIGSFQYGAPGWIPVIGDWTGSGHAGIGVVDPATMTWYLRNEDSPGPPDAGVFQFGAPGWVPVAGTWPIRNRGIGGIIPRGTSIGVFDPSTTTWYLRYEANAGAPDAGVFQYGAAGWVPAVGAGMGSNGSTLAMVDPGVMNWYIGNPTLPFQYGGVGWRPVLGDWNGDGTDTVGVVDPGNVWHLRNSNNAGPSDNTLFAYGPDYYWIPLAGNWVVTNSIGLTRAADRRAEPQGLDEPWAVLSEVPAVAAAVPADPPTPTGTGSLSVASVLAPTGEQELRPGRSIPPAGALAVRLAYLMEQTRTAALDELFATGLE